MKITCLLLLLICLSGCSSKPYINEHPDDYDGTGNSTVYIVSHGWHTGFVIPAQGIQQHIPELKQRFKGAPYLEFGWGDNGFYPAEEITLGLTIQALFWPTESVVHAVAVPEDVGSYFSNSQIERLCLTEEELSSLNRFISKSFYKNNMGSVIKLQHGIYGNSQFYKGVGDFYLMNTCNKWTAKGLKSFGMNIATAFKLTSGNIMNYLAAQRSTQSGQGSANESELRLSCSDRKR